MYVSQVEIITNDFHNHIKENTMSKKPTKLYRVLATREVIYELRIPALSGINAYDRLCDDKYRVEILEASGLSHNGKTVWNGHTNQWDAYHGIHWNTHGKKPKQIGECSSLPEPARPAFDLSHWEPVLVEAEELLTNDD
jgi:hypothetical protein